MIFLLPGVEVLLAGLLECATTLVQFTMPLLALMFVYAQIGNYLFSGLCERRGGPADCGGNDYFGSVSDSLMMSGRVIFANHPRAAAALTEPGE